VGIRAILEAIVKKVPPPNENKITLTNDADQGDVSSSSSSSSPTDIRPADRSLRALVYDSLYESYRGVIVNFRVFNGQVRKGDKVQFMNSGAEHEVTEIGVMLPAQKKVGQSGLGLGSVLLMREGD
jgi:GTP-binding protein LepA